MAKTLNIVPPTPLPLSSEEVTAHKEKIEAYYIALGSFISHFSEVEISSQTLAWKLSGIPMRSAKILFTGNKIDASVKLIKGIYEGKNKNVEPALLYALDHVGEINSLRNSIVHYGVKFLEKDMISSNKIIAKKNKIKNYPVSIEILGKATLDLYWINTIFGCFKMRKNFTAKQFNDLCDTFLKFSWTYKFQQPKSDNRKKSDTARKAVRKSSRQP